MGAWLSAGKIKWTSRLKRAIEMQFAAFLRLFRARMDGSCSQDCVAKS